MALSPGDPSRQGRLSPPMARVKNDAGLQLNKRATPRSPGQAAPRFSMDLLIARVLELEPWECTHFNANPSWAEAHSSGDHGGHIAWQQHPHMLPAHGRQRQRLAFTLDQLYLLTI